MLLHKPETDFHVLLARERVEDVRLTFLPELIRETYVVENGGTKTVAISSCRVFGCFWIWFLGFGNVV